MGLGPVAGRAAAEGIERRRPRRGRCGGCAATHVLISTDSLLRRRDLAEVIGAALVAKAAGVGHRRAALAAGAPVSTVRGWLRRFAANAEAIRVWFTVLAHGLDPMLAPLAQRSAEPTTPAAVLDLAVKLKREAPGLPHAARTGRPRALGRASGGLVVQPPDHNIGFVVDPECGSSRPHDPAAWSPLRLGPWRVDRYPPQAWQ